MVDRKTNPRNPQSNLFRKLTRLLSGPLVDYRSQQPRRYKKGQLDNYKTRFKSASGQQFKKANYSPYDQLTSTYMSNQNRAERYVDFDQMEYTPEIASALDIYADEMTTSSNINPLLAVRCPNEEIKMVLENLYHNIMNINYNLFGWCRTMCKFGDFFLYLDIDEDEGIIHVLGLPPHEVERLEGEDKSNPNYVQFQWNSAGMTFENWQVSHFRILGNDKYSPYGTSILEPARRIWRQLTLIEDAMMAYRIVRSPERRVFYVDVGSIPPQDIEQYMQKVMTQMKRNQLIDQTTGRVDLRYNPMSIEEDYFIPVRGDTSTKIETLVGGSYTGDIDDVKYLRDKLFSALKIPASYLSQTESAQEDKTTLAQKDIRFARTVQRLQRSIISELEKIGVIHLFTMGYRGKDLTSFRLALNNPSKLAQLMELEHWRTRFEIAGAANEGFFSKRWISENLFNLPEEEQLRMQREMFTDKQIDAELEKAVEQITAAGAGGEDLGLGGEELGGEELGDEELGGLEGEEGEDLEAATGDEEGMLLSAPSKRDDDMTTTTRSKGKWYMPVKDDHRDTGAYRRHLRGLTNTEIAKPVKRNIKGYNELLGLSKGITETLESNYKQEERQLFEINTQTASLIRQMELNKDEV